MVSCYITYVWLVFLFSLLLVYLVMVIIWEGNHSFCQMQDSGFVELVIDNPNLSHYSNVKVVKVVYEVTILRNY